jgi:mRNA interferase MazF
LSTVKLSKGDVVLTKFPFTDLSGVSVRPALVISPSVIGEDVVLTAISSVVRGVGVASTDFVLPTTHPDFSLTGLRVSSVVRTHKLFTVQTSVVVRRLGLISPAIQLEIDKLLHIVLGL